MIHNAIYLWWVLEYESCICFHYVKWMIISQKLIYFLLYCPKWSILAKNLDFNMHAMGNHWIVLIAVKESNLHFHKNLLATVWRVASRWARVEESHSCGPSERWRALVRGGGNGRRRTGVAVDKERGESRVSRRFGAEAVGSMAVPCTEMVKRGKN